MRILQTSDSKLGLSPDSARDRLSRVCLNLGLSPTKKFLEKTSKVKKENGLKELGIGKWKGFDGVG